MYFSKIKKITFGKNIAFQIKDYKHIKQIITKLYDILNINNKKYIRITNQSDLAYIKQNNYLVAPNFNGKESFFFFFKINSTYYNVIIFKEDLRQNILDINFNYIHIYKIKINIPKSYYNGTMFDGVLFNKNKKTFFIINDIVINNGSLIDDTIVNKQKITNKLIDDLNKHNDFVVVINKFFDINQIKTLYYDKIKNSEFDINGMIFIDSLKNNTIFNIYSNDVHSKSITGVFNMKKYTLTDVYILECNDNNELKKWGIARIPNLKQSLHFQQVFKNKDNIKVKCLYNLRFNKWEPIDILNDSTQYSNFNNLKYNVQQII
jgi:hypothetical protein